MRWIALAALLTAGCQYPGPPGAFDYWAAASPSWVVQVSNGFVCRDQTTQPEPNNRGMCVAWSYLGCGVEPSTDPIVAYDPTAGRFWYAVLATPLGGPATICLSSGFDPFVLDRAYRVPATAFGITDLDRPQLAVSASKVAVATVDLEHAKTPVRTLVLSKADLIAGVAPHSALIKYGDFVTLATVIGSDDPLAWVRPMGKGADVGLITGVPGINGGIRTTSKLVTGTNAGGEPVSDAPVVSLPAGGGMQEGRGLLLPSTAQAVVRDGRGAGMDLWLLTRTLRNGARELALARVAGLTPTFAPRLDSADAIGLPPGAEFFFTPSLGVEDQGKHALVGFTGAGAALSPTPFLLGKVNGVAGVGPTVAQAIGTPVNGFVRVDYSPTGAQFTIGTVRFAGVAWEGLGANIPGVLDGRTATFYPFDD